MEFSKRNRTIFFIILVIFSFCNPTQYIMNQNYNNQIKSNVSLKFEQNNSEMDFSIPFDGLQFLYGINIKYLNLTIKNIYLLLDYIEINDSNIDENITDQFDFIQEMSFSGWLISFIGFTSENASFYENSSNREIMLKGFEGFYIPTYLEGYSAYNLSEGGVNWTPFWINASDAMSTNEYGIYSFLMQYNQTLVIPSNAYTFFDEPRPLITFNSKIKIIDTNLGVNFTHSLGLIYDNLTGVLLNGLLKSTFKNSTNTYTYEMEMELIYSNVFEVYSDYYLSNVTSPNINTTENAQLLVIDLPPPNYLFLGIIIVSPLIVLLFRFVRMKEIEGGTQ